MSHRTCEESPHSYLELSKPRRMSRAMSGAWRRCQQVIHRVSMPNSSWRRFTLEGDDRGLLHMVKSRRDQVDAADYVKRQIEEMPFVSLDTEKWPHTERLTCALVGCPNGTTLVFMADAVSATTLADCLGREMCRLIASPSVYTIGADVHRDGQNIELGNPIDTRALMQEWQRQEFITIPPTGEQSKTGLKHAAYVLFQATHDVFWKAKNVFDKVRKHNALYGEDLTAPQLADRRGWHQWIRSAVPICSIRGSRTSQQYRSLSLDGGVPWVRRAAGLARLWPARGARRLAL